VLITWRLKVDYKIIDMDHIEVTIPEVRTYDRGGLERDIASREDELARLKEILEALNNG
jgi:hypothetical protein